MATHNGRSRLVNHIFGRGPRRAVYQEQRRTRWRSRGRRAGGQNVERLGEERSGSREEELPNSGWPAAAQLGPRIIKHKSGGREEDLPNSGSPAVG